MLRMVSILYEYPYSTVTTVIGRSNSAILINDFMFYIDKDNHKFSNRINISRLFEGYEYMASNQ